MTISGVNGRTIGTVVFLVVVPVLLLAWAAVRHYAPLPDITFINTPFDVIFSTAVALYFYVFDKQRNESFHQKEIMFTWLLFVVALMSAAFPLTSVKQNPLTTLYQTTRTFGGEKHVVLEFTEESSLNARAHLPKCLWAFAGGTPCRLLGPEDSFDRASGEIRPSMIVDRFTIWEVVALCQTFMFAITLFCELGIVYPSKFKLASVTMLILLFGGSLAAWHVMTRELIPNVVLTLLFASYIFFIDWVTWRQMRAEIRELYKKHLASMEGRWFAKLCKRLVKPMGLIEGFEAIACAVKAADSSVDTSSTSTAQLRGIARLWAEYTCATRIAFVTDLVGVIAVLVLLLCAIGGRWTAADPYSFENEIAIRFSAGGAAVSLMFANFSLVVFRLLKHIELYYLEEKRAGIGEYLGLARQAAPNADAAEQRAPEHNDLPSVTRADIKNDSASDHS